jgi:outer membrane protein TolC
MYDFLMLANTDVIMPRQPVQAARSLFRPVILAAALFLVLAPAAPAAARDVVVGLAADGPSPVLSAIAAGVEAELEEVVRGRHGVSFKQAPEFDAGWDPDRVDRALAAAQADPEVDMVLTLGPMTTHAASRPGTVLAKPTLGGVFLDEELLDLPVADNGSTKANFTCVILGKNVRQDLEALAGLAGPGDLAVPLDAPLVQGMPGLVSRFRDLAAGAGFTARFLPVGVDPGQAVRALQTSGNPDAVYLPPLFRLDPGDLGEVIDQLTAMGVPSFSLLGQPDVKRGVLAGLIPDVRTQFHRRLALHLQQLIEGAEARGLRVRLPVDTKLHLNMATARAIGFAPDFDTMLQARLLEMDKAGPGVPAATAGTLTLEAAMLRAARNNPSLAAEGYRAAEAAKKRDLALSPMLPQISATTSWTAIDHDRASASMGAAPEQRTAAGLSLGQMIYDDEVVSRYRQAGRLAEAGRLEQRAAERDVMLAAGLAYLQWLSDTALLSIERDNVGLVESNIELARMRRRIGVSGPEEVYRWEVQLAQAQSRYIAKVSDVNSSLARLNRAMGSSTSRSWTPVAIGPQEAGQRFLGGALTRVVDDMQALARLRDFSLETAMKRDRIQALEQGIEARRMALGMHRRSFFVPRLGAGLEYEQELSRQEAEARTISLPGQPPLPLPGSKEAYQETWSARVTLSLPLFSGGARAHEMSLARIRLGRLNAEREAFGQMIREEVDTSLDRLLHSWPDIELRRRAADNAARNLDLVREKYAQGTVPILVLLDAQNQALAQEQAAVLAVYAYLGDLLRYQRAIDWMQVARTSRERLEFARKLKESLSGAAPENPATPGDSPQGESR